MAGFAIKLICMFCHVELMTNELPHINIHSGKVGVPRQLVINRDASAIPELVSRAGLNLPLGMYMLVFQLLLDAAVMRFLRAWAHGHLLLRGLCF